MNDFNNISFLCENNIEQIIYKYQSTIHHIKFKWNELRKTLIHPKSTLMETIKSYPELPLNNFLIGLSSVMIITDVTEKYGYLRLLDLPSGYEIFTSNNLKLLRMAIIFHLKCISENQILIYAINFINNWNVVFIKGEKVEKTEVLLELITKYLISTSLENRVKRIESVLGIYG